jgi:signal transduction histidine kinase
VEDGTQRVPSPGTAGESPQRRSSLDPAGTGLEPGLQGIVTRALERVGQETGCAQGAVWWRDRAGEPAVLGALGATAAPSPDALSALLGLPGPVDLAGRELPEVLQRLARETGLAAAAPISAPGGAVGAILLAGPDDPPGAVRPRTLAAAGAAAQRLEAAFAAALGAARLAELDAAAQRLDRLAALGELTAEIVHEIRNPLVSVKTFLQLLPERSDDTEFREQFHAVAMEELRRIERLLDLVLAHGRPAAERPGDAAASLAEVIESITQLLAHRATQAEVTLAAAEVRAGLSAALPEDALRQVLLNLVVNALDATPRGGTVRVRARAAEGGIEVRVEDDGPGVPPALRERVFEPFFSTRPDRPGGLGLAISRRLAERAGGSLRIVDAQGGCFRVWLPTG